jgi:HAD superfamily hydrolase (TIGR01509 family)
MIFLFDCFGVVVDWKSDYVVPLWAKYVKVSDAEFKKQSSEELALCETGQITQDELWQQVGRKLNANSSGLEHIFVECFKKKARLDDGVVEILKGLPQPYLLSNQIPEAAKLCRQNGWFSYFRRTFLSFDIGHMKPDPRAYHFVLKELGVPAHEVVLIDDKKENVDSALKCGMKGIVFSSAGQLLGDLEKLYNVKIAKRKHDVA